MLFSPDHPIGINQLELKFQRNPPLTKQLMAQTKFQLLIVAPWKIPSDSAIISLVTERFRKQDTLSVTTSFP